MQQNNVTVVSNYAIAKNVVRLDLRVEGKLPSITPGQFLTLSTGRGEQLLPKGHRVQKVQNVQQEVGHLKHWERDLFQRHVSKNNER